MAIQARCIGRESISEMAGDDLDLDRQVSPFPRPGDIGQQIQEGVERLSLPEGGLMLWAWVADASIPMENIEALCEAGEKYCLAARPE